MGEQLLVNIPQEQEAQKLKNELNELETKINQFVSGKKEAYKELYSSKEFKELSEKHDQYYAREQFLFETYDRLTKGYPENRRNFMIFNESDMQQYIEDLKQVKADRNSINAFTEFYNKYIKPFKDSINEFNELARELIYEDKNKLMLNIQDDLETNPNKDELMFFAYEKIWEDLSGVEKEAPDFKVKNLYGIYRII